VRFDLGNTTFDLQATTITELFDTIRTSHQPKATHTTHKQGRHILYEMWEQEDMASTHHEE